MRDRRYTPPAARVNGAAVVISLSERRTARAADASEAGPATSAADVADYSPLWDFASAAQGARLGPTEMRWLAGELARVRAMLEARLGRSLVNDGEDEEKSPGATTNSVWRRPYAEIADAPGLNPSVAAMPLDGDGPLAVELAFFLGNRGMATRLIHALRRAGMDRLGQALALSACEIDRMRGVGKTTVERFGAWRTAQGYGGFPALDAASGNMEERT